MLQVKLKVAAGSLHIGVSGLYNTDGCSWVLSLPFFTLSCQESRHQNLREGRTGQERRGGKEQSEKCISPVIFTFNFINTQPLIISYMEIIQYNTCKSHQNPPS